MISNFDENLERLFRHLDDLDLSQDTIVVLTSDHGTAAGFDPDSGDGFNAGMRGKKGSTYDGGHKVSCFLHYPDVLPSNRRITSLTAHVDLFPTLAELCGLTLKPGREFDGNCLRDVIDERDKQTVDRTLFIHLQPDSPIKWHHSVVLTQRWRMIEGRGLYDIHADPGQQDNVADAHADVMSDLRKRYEDWWDDLEPSLSGCVYVPLASMSEPATALTARDWHPLEGRVRWMQGDIVSHRIESNGYWAVEFVKDGKFEVELRRYPVEADLPIEASHARLSIGSRQFQQETKPTDVAAKFRVDVSARQYKMQTWLRDPEQSTELGATYVYVSEAQSAH